MDILIKLYLPESFSLTIQWEEQTSCCENDHRNTPVVGLWVVDVIALSSRISKLPEKS